MSELRLCGLGVDPERDATLEALAALRECAEVYTDGLDEGQRAWLERLGARALPATDAEALVAAAAAAPGPVGLAAWGHAGYTSGLAVAARALAAKRGVACRVLAGVSPLSRHVADERLFIGGHKRGKPIGAAGAQSLSAASLLSGASFETRLPLVVYDPAGFGARAPEVARALRERYPSGAVVTLYPRRGPASRAPLDGALEGLAEAVAAGLPEVPRAR